MSRLRTSCLALVGLLLFTHQSLAAPLFPNLPESHWAKDAVATLAAKGMVEGYPDGTFKGDRASSRWELALIVARLLSDLDRAHTTFATHAGLQELRQLVNALKEELLALGLRVDSLEGEVTVLGKRVTELERITFYGHLETRVVMQSFTNRGARDNSGDQGGGVAGPIPYLDYNAIVGTKLAPPMRPQVHALFPTVDYRNGRALTNGTGLSSLATLGMRIKVSPTLQAGAELKAYASQGSSLVDGYWGVPQPFLSNPSTALAGGGTQGINSSPWTKITLDRFWIEHTPSQTRANLGTIDKTGVDSFVYAGQTNLNVYGPARLPGYGFQILGRIPLASNQNIGYEVLGTRLGHGVNFRDIIYGNRTLSAKLAYEFSRGKVQANVSRLIEEAPVSGEALSMGLIQGTNVAYGASTGWAARQWVNPPGDYVNQLGLTPTSFGFPGNTADTRPIPGWSATSDDAVGYGLGSGGYGPQAQTIYGLSFQYKVPFSKDDNLKFSANLGRSDYRPSRNSSFSSTGNLLQVTADTTLLHSKLDLGLEYLRVDPQYGPLSWSSNLVGVRFPLSMNFTGQFHSFDSGKYPHNREGWRTRLKYRFADNAATIWAEGSFLKQTQTSLYDIRVTGGALGLGTPTGNVLGFAPGFVDPVFYGYASPLQYGPQSRNSFTANLTPLENKRGSQNDFALGAAYAWPQNGPKVSAAFRQYDFRRNSSLSAASGGSQNLVDMTSRQLTLDVDFAIANKIRAQIGADLINTAGHYDPAGLFNDYALRTGSIAFKNLDSQQTIPYVGFTWQINDTQDFGLLVRYYDTDDRVASNVGVGQANLGQIGSTVHPFSWSGLQVSTSYQLRF